MNVASVLKMGEVKLPDLVGKKAQVMLSSEWLTQTAKTCKPTKTIAKELKIDTVHGMYLDCVIQKVMPKDGGTLASLMFEVKVTTTCNRAKKLEIANGVHVVPAGLVRLQPPKKFKRNDKGKAYSGWRIELPRGLKDLYQFLGERKDARTNSPGPRIYFLIRMALGSVPLDVDFGSRWGEIDRKLKEELYREDVEDYVSWTIKDSRPSESPRCAHVLDIQCREKRLLERIEVLLQLHKADMLYKSMKQEAAGNQDEMLRVVDQLKGLQSETVELKAQADHVFTLAMDASYTPQSSRGSPRSATSRRSARSMTSSMESAPAPILKTAHIDQVRQRDSSPQGGNDFLDYQFVQFQGGHSSGKFDKWGRILPSRKHHGPQTQRFRITDDSESRGGIRWRGSRRLEWNSEGQVQNPHERNKPTEWWVETIAGRSGETNVKDGDAGEYVVLRHGYEVLQINGKTCYMPGHKLSPFLDEERGNHMATTFQELARGVRRLANGEIPSLAAYYMFHRFDLEKVAFLGGDVSKFSVGTLLRLENVCVPIALEHQTYERVHEWSTRNNGRAGEPELSHKWKRYYKEEAKRIIASGFQKGTTSAAQNGYFRVLNCDAIAGKLVSDHSGRPAYYCLTLRVRLPKDEARQLLQYHKECETRFHDECRGQAFRGLNYSYGGSSYTCFVKEWQNPRIPKFTQINYQARKANRETLPQSYVKATAEDGSPSMSHILAAWQHSWATNSQEGSTGYSVGIQTPTSLHGNYNGSNQIWAGEGARGFYTPYAPQQNYGVQNHLTPPITSITYWQSTHTPHPITVAPSRHSATPSMASLQAPMLPSGIITPSSGHSPNYCPATPTRSITSMTAPQTPVRHGLPPARSSGSLCSLPSSCQQQLFIPPLVQAQEPQPGAFGQISPAGNSSLRHMGIYHAEQAVQTTPDYIPQVQIEGGGPEHTTMAPSSRRSSAGSSSQPCSHHFNEGDMVYVPYVQQIPTDASGNVLPAGAQIKGYLPYQVLRAEMRAGLTWYEVCDTNGKVYWHPGMNLLPSFKNGQEVEYCMFDMTFDGTWLTGHVLEMNQDGTYQVKTGDGRVKQRWQRQNIRLPQLTPKYPVAVQSEPNLSRNPPTSAALFARPELKKDLSAPTDFPEAIPSDGSEAAAPAGMRPLTLRRDPSAATNGNSSDSESDGCDAGTPATIDGDLAYDGNQPDKKCYMGLAVSPETGKLREFIQPGEEVSHEGLTR